MIEAEPYRFKDVLDAVAARTRFERGEPPLALQEPSELDMRAAQENVAAAERILDAASSKRAHAERVEAEARTAWVEAIERLRKISRQTRQVLVARLRSEINQ